MYFVVYLVCVFVRTACWQALYGGFQRLATKAGVLLQEGHLVDDLPTKRQEVSPLYYSLKKKKNKFKKNQVTLFTKFCLTIIFCFVLYF